MLVNDTICKSYIRIEGRTLSWIQGTCCCSKLESTGGFDSCVGAPVPPIFSTMVLVVGGGESMRPVLLLARGLTIGKVECYWGQSSTSQVICCLEHISSGPIITN